MKSQESRYLYAWITEFCVAAPDAKQMLEDLENRTERIQDSHAKRGGSQREYDHCVLATIGTTDLVEIAYFNHIYHFLEIAESSSRSARRSIGSRCLTSGELSRMQIQNDDYKIVPVEDLATDDSNLPLVAIIYLRLSSAARLSVGTEGCTDWSGPTLIDTFLSRFFQPSAPQAADGLPAWALYNRVLKANRGGCAVKQLRITPLVGLDTVDAILLVRAESLEQVAALTLAVRHQRLDSIWPASESGVANHVKVMSELSNFTEDASSYWNVSALFREVRTTWGLRVQPGSGNAKWRLETCSDTNRPIANTAVSFSRARVAPDRLQDSMKPFGLVNSLQDREKVEAGEGHRTLILFGPFDSLLAPAVEKLFRRVTIGDIRLHFQHLMGVEMMEGRTIEKGIWPATEIAVWMRIPEGFDPPTYKLMKEFRHHLHDRRVRDFARTGTGTSMTQRWLDGARERGISYSTTSAMVNLLLAFMVYLERDPERFSELLPAIQYLIEIVALPNSPRPPETPAEEPTQKEIRWLLSRVNELFGNLSRDYYPLQSPSNTLGAEGQTGHRLAADAFLCLAEALSLNIEPGYRVLSLESPGGGLVCEPGRLKFTALRASPFVLHYPISWLIASEFAHRRLESAAVDELPLRERDALYRLVEAAGTKLSSGADVMRAFGEFGDALDSRVRQSLSRIFVLSLTKVLGELVVDLLLWKSLCLDTDDPTDGLRRFWLIHGPRIVSAKRDLFGHLPPNLSVLCQITLRVFFTNYLIGPSTETRSKTAPVAPPKWNWSSSLLDLLVDLSERDFSLKQYRTRDLGHQERSYVHLQCLRTDLGIPDAKWFTATDMLRASVQHIADNESKVEELTTDWLRLAQSLASFWLWRSTPESPARALFCDYLSELLNDWETSDPWPPFIKHHTIDIEIDVNVLRNKSVPRSRLRSDDPSGGFISKRGGVFMRGSDPAQDVHGVYASNLLAQKNYHLKTGQLIKRLADQSRRTRLKHLREFLLPH